MSTSERPINETVDESVDEFFESRCKIHTESESELISSTVPTLSDNTICPLINEHAFECAICLDLLCEPVTLSCGHTYCQHCISQWIISHTLSKSPTKEKCRCPSCKAIIYNKFEQSTSYTLRDFLKNQFTVKYEKRCNETLSIREKWNKQIIKLKKQRDDELKQLQKCCGIIRLKRWIFNNFELMINPNLHQNARSWLFRWLLLYIVILCLIIPFIVPIITKLLSQQNNTRNYTESTGINVYFLDDIFEYFGLNTISKVSTITFGPIIHLFHGVLQYFGAIVPIKNTAYLPDHYIINSLIPYDSVGNIYNTDSTDLYYRNLFQEWKSSELKSFLKRYNVENTCLERSCYTDTIMQYLKISEWERLQNDPLPISILQQYLNHYNVDYKQCYDDSYFWSYFSSKNYQCFAENAASIKILNDVYYHKKYLLSFKATRPRKSKNRNNDHYKQQQREDKQNYNHQHQNQQHHQHQHRRDAAFGFDDIGNFAFSILSGLR